MKIRCIDNAVCKISFFLVCLPVSNKQESQLWQGKCYSNACSLQATFTMPSELQSSVTYIDTDVLKISWIFMDVSTVQRRLMTHLPELIKCQGEICYGLFQIICETTLCVDLSVQSPYQDFSAQQQCDDSGYPRIIQTPRKKEQVDEIILDFSKAFDNVAHNRLLANLDNFGIRGACVNGFETSSWKEDNLWWCMVTHQNG